MNDLQFFSHPKQLKKLKLDITSRLERDDETIAPHTNVSLRFVLMSLRNGYVPTSIQQAGKLPKPQTFSRAPKCGSENILFAHTSSLNIGFSKHLPKTSCEQYINENKLTNQKLAGGLKKIFYFYPYLGKVSILTSMFQLGWSTHHLERHFMVSQKN